jgi:hypothetical protein
MRGNPIQMYDTAFIRMELNDVEIFFVATHCGEEYGGIKSFFEFEHGEITYKENGNFVGKLNDGTVIDYGNPDADNHNKIWKFISSLRGESDIGFSCPIEAAIAHNRIMIAALISSEIGTFSDVRDDGNRFFVPGVDAVCLDCYDSLQLPNTTWAKPGAVIRLDDSRIDLYGDYGSNTQ